MLKKLGTIIHFPVPIKGHNTVTIALFSDTGRSPDHGPLSYISGLLLGPLEINSTFYTISCMSHKSEILVRSIAAAEILAASKAIVTKYLKVLQGYLGSLLKMKIPGDSIY